jgi:hypothetical protein
MNPTSNSPAVYEGAGLVIDQVLGEVHTCTPARVLAFNVSAMTVDVQPTLQRVYVGQPPVDLPVIYQVPLVLPRVAGAWLRLPVAAGDLVMLHFSERSLDAWSQTDGQKTLDPVIPHRFSLGDAIAVPGLYPQGKPLQPKGAAGNLELANGSGWLEISPSGQFKFSNGTVSLLDMLDTLLTHLQNLTTTNAVVGAPCALSPATLELLAQDQAKLEALKLS